MKDTDLCPCASGRNYGACCGPVIAGAAKAETAEALMRARYTAYATQNMDFLYLSGGPEVRASFDRNMCMEWSKSAEWQGLEVIATERGGAGDSDGIVEFKANYSVNGKPCLHHETAKFERIDGEWRFIDGDIEGQTPLRRSAPKIGRNDPCPCGSGKKYKKCCGRSEA